MTKRDLRTGTVGYRPADDPDLRLAAGQLETIWRARDMPGAVPDDEAIIGPCGGCGRTNAVTRPVVDDAPDAPGLEPARSMLCDACLLDDVRGLR